MKNNNISIWTIIYLVLGIGIVLVSFLDYIKLSFIILGFISIIIGLNSLYKDIQIERLLKMGTKLSLTVLSVETVHMKIGTAYRMVTQWLNPKDNKTYIFKSEKLLEIPKQFSVGNNIDVYVDLVNPERYFVDIRPYSKIR